MASLHTDSRVRVRVSCIAYKRSSITRKCVEIERTQTTFCSSLVASIAWYSASYWTIRSYLYDAGNMKDNGKSNATNGQMIVSFARTSKMSLSNSRDNICLDTSVLHFKG